jgi:hypothetical protein
VRERWPPNPLYHHALRSLQLADFSYPETRAYLSQRGIPAKHHQQLYRLTQGHPLTLALVVSLCEESGLPPTVPEATDRAMQHVLTWALRGVDEEDDASVRVTEMLRASAVVRRFSQSLLAAMLEQERIPDGLFDRVTALSMVVEREQRGVTEGDVFADARLFVLHDVLRNALLEDAQGRG